MKVAFDIDTYKNKFLGGARAFHFYVNFNFPGFANAARAGMESALGGSGITDVMSSGGTMSNLIQTGNDALTGAAPAAIDVVGVGSGTNDFSYYVKSTSLPSTSIEELVTHWMGQPYKIAGIQNYEDWTISLHVDVNADVLKSFGKWQKMIRNPQTNILARPSTYTCDQDIHLLGPDGSTICMYRLYNAWPKSVGAVALDFSDTSVATVDVTFAYQYHVVFETEPGSLVEFARKSITGGINSLV